MPPESQEQQPSAFEAQQDGETPQSAQASTPASALQSEPTTVAHSALSGPVAERRFGPYFIVGELAAGAMGVVYHARDERLGREVALKVIRDGVLAHPDSIERFGREARAVAQLKHANIVPLYDVGEVDGRHYFTMELAHSGSLVRQRTRLQADRRAAVTVLIKIARAVQHVHEQGMLHRDLKPGNILLKADNEPMISDFGLAKVVGIDPDLTRTGAAVGTPAYMAPEQAAGQTRRIGPATDLWSLGVIAYELLCGKRPFAATDDRRLEDVILQDAPPPPRAVQPDLPRELETILLKSLEKAPARRYISATAFADDLEAWLNGQPIKARPVGSFDRMGRWLSGHFLVAGMCLAFLAALLGLAIAWRGGEAPSPLKKAESELLQEQPVTLLGAVGEPVYAQWLTPGKASEQPEAPFRIAADSYGLILLLPDPQVPHYRAEAEVLADADAVGAGLFVCHSAHATANGPLHAQCLARLNPRSAKTFLELGHYVPNNKASPYHGLQTGAAIKLPKAATDWLRVAVDVSPELIRFSVDKAEIAALPKKTRVTFAKQMLTGRPEIVGEVHPVFGPRGGLGLFVEQGAASFRNVTIIPLSPNRP